ncbi:hypothetical protein [Streptomyces sp. NRRL S-340]|uniref:hypothetical protein n=1 Tax=Streptomyces sp. NRRL S-340 TaxID=1463901 RepID=UPI0005676C9B|nr:hypothetical protein [Streptomyces sp. NRRL S-340]
MSTSHDAQAGARPRAGKSDAGQRRGGLPPLVVVLLLALVGLLAVLWLPLGVLARVAALVLLWISPRWSVRDKSLATLVAVVLTAALDVFLYFVDPAGVTPQRLAAAVEIVLPASAAGWLWRTRR